MTDGVTYTGEANPRTMFVEGPFGAGKTDFALDTLYTWLEAGVDPQRMLVLVPQRTLAAPYYEFLSTPELGPMGAVEVRTINGLAQDVSTHYWPTVAEKVGFANADARYHLLTIETAQYAMADFVNAAVENGEFEALNLSPQQIARQIVDTLGKAELMGVPYTEIPRLLSAAWGTERPAKRRLAYEAAGRVAHAYRQHCLERGLLDYSMQLHMFKYVLDDPDTSADFFGSRTHLIAEHVEEENPLTHALLHAWLPLLEGALLTYETDGGYRVFLGADPAGGSALRGICEGMLRLDRSFITPPQVETLRQAVAFALRRGDAEPAPEGEEVGFDYTFHQFYPEMIQWVADTIHDLVENQGIPPGEIVVLAPYLSDALRFALGQALDAHGVPHVSHRPSRALRDEPAARTLLTLAALANPQWKYRPPQEDVAHALQHAIAGLDPVRAGLLAKVVYRPGGGEWLTSFERIAPAMQTRITYAAGTRYEVLRDWIQTYAMNEDIALDTLFSEMFGQLLSQPGFGFHDDPEAGRVAGELVESAQKFRTALNPSGRANMSRVNERYFNTVRQGLLAALYVTSWDDEMTDSVFFAPAYTFLLHNRPATVQFWLDVGSTGWWERIDQPLTHPYVLSPRWPEGQLWTDADEYETQQEMLYRLTAGLLRRCSGRVYLGITDLGEQGYEQRGPLLRVFQQVLRRHPREEMPHA